MDTEEDAVFGDRRGDDLPAVRSQRLARLKACQEQLQQKADARARRQQDKMAAREAEEKASGKVKRGRKPKPADATVAADAKANPTDPDSRIMKGRKGYLQGYNAQAVVTQEQIIIAPDVTNQANRHRVVGCPRP